jgi:sodium-dependent phosphate cotransporter
VNPASTPQSSLESFTCHPLVRALVVLALLFVFLVGVNGLGDGFKSLGQDVLDSFFSATENPFIALMVGVLATTLAQSSSVTTSMIVALVAAPENPLPIANAVPMVMGANIGTTVTNTMVSLAHMGRREEFRRAFAVATCHDFFNFLTVAVLLPLELVTGYLQRSATWLASLVMGAGGMDYESPVKGVLKATVVPIKAAIGAVVESPRIAGILLIIASAGLIFTALFLLVRTMRSAMQTRVEVVLSLVLGRTAILAMLVGLVVTTMVQSSSITTSLLVPLAGAGLLTLEHAFPVTIGANIGTTVTALLASIAVTGVNASAGVTIALVHLLFNLSGTMMVYPIPAVRNIPLSAARKLADIATKSRHWAVVYVLLLFYGLPAAFAALNQILR